MKVRWWPDRVIGFIFSLFKLSSRIITPGGYSASNINEYQKSSLGWEGGGGVRRKADSLAAIHEPIVSRKCGNLDVS
jgi:hypothetical protein